MPDGQVLEFSGVTKRFGGITAVDGLNARVEPGAVTGFLGPNGAGKTTSLRVLLGLVRPTDGVATIGGTAYRSLAHPLQTVGAVLEASSFHPGRTGANHLRVYANAAGLSRARVDEVLGLVGLSDAAGRKVGGYSLGMRQRLGLAYALLGDPGVLVLDEPTNGLDPEGIRWIRGFLQQLAREGRTVFVSSHLLAEVQQTVDSLLIISAGRLVFQGGIEELADPDEMSTVVDAPDRDALGAALTAAGLDFEVLRSGATVRDADPVAVGRIAADAGIALSSLHRRGPALEEVFLELANGTRVHPSAAAAPAVAVATDAAEPDAAAEPAPETSAEVAPDTPADAPEEPSDAAPDAPPAHAAFAVAATGVIDVIADAADDAEAEPADALPAEPAPIAGEPAAPAAEADTVETDAPEGPPDGDLAREDTPKTDSDIEADAFFAAFDSPHHSGDDDAVDAPPDAESEPDPDPEPQPEPDTDTDTDTDTEDGDPR